MATDKRIIEMRPRKPAKPREFPVRLVLTLVVDGQPRAMLPIEVTVSVPPEGQGVEVGLPVDARELATLLEPLVGPAKPKLWTPKD